MILRSDNFYLFLLFASVFSSFVFCIGFFPYAQTLHKTNGSERPTKTIEPKINKTVVMIIDALRLDFIESESFSYLHQILDKKEACLLKLTVSLPTVTKPRIKAITSGTIPSFLDVVMNFGNDEMTTDTFLHQLKKRNDKIVFAGDETWKMFRLFEREYANRDSLFVNDFYEGDKNVTESLGIELKRLDWKLLILHYLGLDHIGHVEGPFSRLVPAKLKEMDDVIRKIHETLKDWNSKSEMKSVLIVTGDHGMRDSGGHSGNSFAETHIPLIVIGGDCESNSDKFYNQIDFAPTFSILNGLPLPSSSIGSIIPEMLSNLTQIQKLDIFRIINQHLVDLASNDVNEEFRFQFEKAKQFHKMFANDSANVNAFSRAEDNYLTSSRGISDQLARLSMEVNLLNVLLGLTFNIIIVLTLLIPCDGLTKDIKLTSSSFIPFIAGGIALKLLVFNEVFAQVNDLNSFVVIACMSSILRVVIGVLLSKYERFKWFSLFDNDLLYMCIIGHTFFVISVGSSSFVEEEHQIWYYFCNAMFAFLALFDFRGHSEAKSYVSALARCIPFLILHVVIRRMNATGDKWINIPDLSDWLHEEAHHGYLNAFIALSLAASAVWLAFIHCTSLLMIPFVLIGNALLYFHHTRSITNRNDLPVTTIFWVNLGAIIVIDIVKNLKTKKFNFFLVFFFLSMILHQPQNVVMGFACAVTCWFLNRSCNRMIKNTSERVIAKIFLHVWAGKLFYFYQGNSNSLSTVDVNAGFVGQMHVHLPIIFVFSTINTFNGQLMSLILLVNHLGQDSKRLMDDSGVVKQLLFKWLSILTIIPTTVFLVVITILRHHLFIWSVFSPKLLYDFFSSALMLLVLIIVKLTIKL